MSRVNRKPVRLAVVAQHPIHYHLPLYRAMAADRDLDAEILFMQSDWSESGFDPLLGTVVDWGASMFEGYPYRICRNISPLRNGEGFWKFINPGLILRILAGPFDTVYIHGHNHFTHLMCLIAARLGGKKLVLRTIACNLGERPLIKDILRTGIYRLLYTLPHVLLHIGRRNREYYLDFGVAESRLVHAPHIVDNDYFTSAAERLSGDTAALKAEFGLNADDHVILSPTKIRAVKQPLRLMDAFRRANLTEDWVLLMVGEGPMRAEAEAFAARHRDVRIVFTGFLDQSRIPQAYAISDIIALPSQMETWGLVVNEAFNFGCAAIVSDRVACAPDLVEGKGGLVVPWDDTDALADAIRELACDDALRHRFQAGARRTIATWNVDAYMVGLREALGLPPPT